MAQILRGDAELAAFLQVAQDMLGEKEELAGCGLSSGRSRVVAFPVLLSTTARGMTAEGDTIICGPDYSNVYGVKAVDQQTIQVAMRQNGEMMWASASTAANKECYGAGPRGMGTQGEHWMANRTGNANPRDRWPAVPVASGCWPPRVLALRKVRRWPATAGQLIAGHNVYIYAAGRHPRVAPR